MHVLCHKTVRPVSVPFLNGRIFTSRALRLWVSSGYVLALSVFNGWLMNVTDSATNKKMQNRIRIAFGEIIAPI